MSLSSPVRQTLWTRNRLASILNEMATYQREVGEQLKRLRESRNWSQEDAAHNVGVRTVATWGRWERGESMPYEANWQRLAVVFGEEEIRSVRGTPPAFAENGSHDRLERIEAKLDELGELVDRLVRNE